MAPDINDFLHLFALSSHFSSHLTLVLRYFSSMFIGYTDEVDLDPFNS